MAVETRKVGERGQVTIPKDLREKENIQKGDRIEFKEENGCLRMRKKDDIKEDLREGYQEMVERDRKIAEDWKHTSQEANQYVKEE